MEKLFLRLQSTIAIVGSLKRIIIQDTKKQQAKKRCRKLFGFAETKSEREREKRSGILLLCEYLYIMCAHNSSPHFFH